MATPEFLGAAGGGAPIPQIAGTWRGQTQFQVLVNLTTQVVTREVVMTLGTDPAGNLDGLFCQRDSTAFPAFCLPLIGKVQSNGAVQIEFSNNFGGDAIGCSGIHRFQAIEVRLGICQCALR